VARASRQPLVAGGRTPCRARLRVAPVFASCGGEFHGMSTPTDSLTDPLAYAPKWAREAAIAERRNAAEQDRKRNESPDGAWPMEWSPAARSVDPIVLPPPPSRSLRRVRFAIAGGMAISAAAGAITALFVVGKLPSWGLVTRDASLGVASFEARFIGQDDQTAGASLSTANRQPRLAVPLRQTDGASPRATASEEPRLAEPLRGAIADHASSTATEVASPSAAANEEPRLAEALRQTDGASPTPSALNPDAIAAFLERAQELVASGDFAAARVLLLRAAEARDPKAALALAATFDPIILQRTGAYGVVSEVPSARHWYEKAKEFGSEEASQRLEMLARRQM
jgi:TPR repeat protein